LFLWRADDDTQAWALYTDELIAQTAAEDEFNSAQGMAPT